MSNAPAYTRLRRTLTAAILAVGVAAPLLQTTAAEAARPTPKAPVALPAAIEGMPKYDPASMCSPTAKPGAVKLMNTLLRTYPSSRSLGISRACGSGGKSEHKEGRAIDWGNRVWVASEKANVDAFVAWATGTDKRGNKYQGVRRLGIMYMIWNDRIWSASNPGWRPYVHPACKSIAGCSSTLRHRDHLHISLNWAGAKGATSFWTGKVGASGGAAVSPATHASNPKAVTSWDHTVLRRGSQGSAVTALQKALRMTAVTGNFGPITERSVKVYQYKHRLPQTGLVASMTWGALRRELAAESKKIASVNKKVLRPGARGAAVRVLEASLNSPIDGAYTKRDLVRVRFFQLKHRLPVTGTVASLTWAALRGI